MVPNLLVRTFTYMYVFIEIQFVFQLGITTQIVFCFSTFHDIKLIQKSKIRIPTYNYDRYLLIETHDSKITRPAPNKIGILNKFHRIENTYTYSYIRSSYQLSIGTFIYKQIRLNSVFSRFCHQKENG